MEGQKWDGIFFQTIFVKGWLFQQRFDDGMQSLDHVVQCQQ